jgi:A/G-specific adenine glycosylase
MKQVVVALLWRNGKILIDQRPEQVAFGGFWELPGGKVEPGETPEQALARELQEELGLTVTVEALLTSLDHHYPKFSLTFLAYRCTAPVGDPQPLASQQVRWVSPSVLKNYPFPEATVQLLAQIFET